MMEVTLFLSVKDIVSHSIREDLKMFRQKSHTIFLIYFTLLNANCKNDIQFFTEQFCFIKSFLLVTLGIFSQSLSCHKTFGSYKTIRFYSGKFHIFRYSSRLTKGHRKEGTTIKKWVEGKLYVTFLFALSPYIAAESCVSLTPDAL
jgi:hypothetical protein